MGIGGLDVTIQKRRNIPIDRIDGQAQGQAGRDSRLARTAFATGNGDFHKLLLDFVVGRSEAENSYQELPNLRIPSPSMALNTFTQRPDGECSAVDVMRGQTVQRCQ